MDFPQNKLNSLLLSVLKRFPQSYMDFILNQPDIPHKEESSDLWLYSGGKDILQNFGNEP